MNRLYPDFESRVIANSVLSPVDFYAGSPCWIWTGTFRVNYCGRKYPTMSMRLPDRKHPVPVQVTRKVLEIVKGLRMTKIHVAAHCCNNTVCVNPEHLRRDTQGGNIQQAHDEGRAYNRRTWRDGSSGHVHA